MESVFGAILRDLVEGHPEIIGAVFADWEGETVDLYSRETDGAFDVRVLGAHLSILLRLINRAHHKKELGGLLDVTMTTQRAIYVISPVDLDYYIGLWSTAGAPL